MTALVLDAPPVALPALDVVECALCHDRNVPVDESRACTDCLRPFCDNHLELCDDEQWRCPDCDAKLPGDLMDAYDIDNDR